VSKLSAKCPKITVPTLTGDFITVKSATWYVHKILTNFVSVNTKCS